MERYQQEFMDKVSFGSETAIQAMREWEATQIYLERIASISREHGAKVVLLYMPLNEQEIIRGSSNVASLLDEWPRQHPIQYVNGLEVYTSYLVNRGYFASDRKTIPGGFVSDGRDLGHAGQLASLLLAEALYAYVEAALGGQ